MNHRYCNYDIGRKIKGNEYMYDYPQIIKIRSETDAKICNKRI